MMKSWKKLFLCIAVSIAITSFLGITTFMIKDRMTLNYYANHQDELKERASFEDAIRRVKDKKDKSDDNLSNIQDNNITSDDILNYGEEAFKDTYLYSLAHEFSSILDIYNLYFGTIVIGTFIGFLIYLLFIQKTKSNKILIYSILGFVVTFLIINLKYIIQDVLDGSLDIENYLSLDNTLNVFFIIYMLSFMFLYTINLIHQKNIAKELNIALDNNKKE